MEKEVRAEGGMRGLGLPFHGRAPVRRGRGAGRGLERARARHRGWCGAATVSRCRGAEGRAWRRVALARGGGRPGRALCAFGRRGACTDTVRGRRLRCPAGCGAGVRGSSEVREREGARHGAAMEMPRHSHMRDMARPCGSSVPCLAASPP